MINHDYIALQWAKAHQADLLRENAENRRARMITQPKGRRTQDTTTQPANKR